MQHYVLFAHIILSYKDALCNITRTFDITCERHRALYYVMYFACCLCNKHLLYFTIYLYPYTYMQHLCVCLLFVRPIEMATAVYSQLVAP